MPVTWPTTNSFPQSPLTGFVETPGENTIRTQNDSGPAKLRRLTTSAPTTFQLPFILTEAQADDLMTFYETTTFYGVKTFDGLPHPRTDSASVEWRFLEPPSLTLIEYDTYQVVLRLELLP